MWILECSKLKKEEWELYQPDDKYVNGWETEREAKIAWHYAFYESGYFTPRRPLLKFRVREVEK